MFFIIRVFKLLFGYFLYAIGIMVTINANIGYAPWDIFHTGVSSTTGISLGMINILTGFILLIITVLMGEKFGIGTIGNMFAIGIFIDLIVHMNFIPKSDNLLLSLFMFISGLIIICFAIYFSIDTGFGAGPRDSLMVAISRKTKLSIGVSRGLIEFTVAVIGYFLGGMVGLGTAVFVVVIGPIMQNIFKALKFDPKAVEHETFKDTYRLLFKKVSTESE